MPGVIERLVALLASATPADLDELDDEIARLTALRGLVAGALALPPTVSHVVPDAPAPALALSGPSGPPTPKAASRRAGAERRRLAVARVLSDGPLGAHEVAKRCGIPKGSVTEVLTHPWFEKADGGKFAPWGLTDAGREAVAADRGN